MPHDGLYDELRPLAERRPGVTPSANQGVAVQGKNSNSDGYGDAAASPALRRAEEIRATLQAEIEGGTLPPGTALDEKALTERFGVSRTPVREALQQLVARDLVRITRRHGVTVSKLSVNKVRGILEFISELEGVASKLAARRLTTELGHQLTEALAACEQAQRRGDADAYAAANNAFHDAIYLAARNDYLVDNLRTSRRMIKRYSFGPLFTPRQMASSYADHQQIEKAIQAGDEMAAAQASKRHVPYGNSGFSEFLALVPTEYIGDEDGV